MAQLNTSDFRKGSKIILDGEPFDMLEVNFVKPGKGQALYKCRLKNLIKGTILDRTYKSGDSLEAADIRNGEGQFLYKDASGLVFMDQENFEQFTIPTAVAGDQARFLQDNAVCVVLFWGELPIGVTAPAQAVMKVTYTETVTRGNTSSNLTKPATVENGETVQVPAFVEMGEMIRINAQTGEYIERVR
jgi:elongation factor P